MEKIRSAILKTVVFPAIVASVFMVITFFLILHEIETGYISSRKEITSSTANLIYSNVQLFYSPPYIKHLIESSTKGIKDKEHVFFYYREKLYGDKGSKRFFDICRNADKLSVYDVSGKLLVCYPIYTEIASSLLFQENRRVDAIFGVVYSRSEYVNLRNQLLGGVGLLFVLTGVAVSAFLFSFYRNLLSDISKFSNIIETLKSGVLKVDGGLKFAFWEFFSIYRLIRQLVNRINRLIDRLEKEATVDILTGLYNRNFLRKLTVELTALHERVRKPLSTCMIDIDDFKLINDTFGHEKGDEVLRRVGEIIMRQVRRSDFPFRFGGEEFLILFPETSKFQAVIVCERIRNAIQREDFGTGRHITVSIGVASMPEDTRTYVDISELIRIADERLYAAKRGGKNRTVSENSTG